MKVEYMTLIIQAENGLISSEWFLKGKSPNQAHAPKQEGGADSRQ